MTTLDLRAVRWIHGSPNCDESTDPPIQVVAFDDDTYVLRQSKCVDFEGPFLYLLIGADAALLLDTGATADADAFPIRRSVDEIIGRRGGFRTLTVAHSHGHRDHRAGDVQFADHPSASVVPVGAEGVAAFFGLTDWPAGQATLDLGNRPIDILPTPGHAPDHIMLFDRSRGLLLSGDAFYPGMLTVRDWAAFRTSTSRVAAFVRDAAAAGHPTHHVLGSHIEMTSRPGELYPLVTTYQPEEHVLPLSVDHLYLLEARLDVAGATPQSIAGDDFTVEPMDGS